MKQNRNGDDLSEMNENNTNNTDKQQQKNWQQIRLTDSLNINKSEG
jgi:hypothetical protein